MSDAPAEHPEQSRDDGPITTLADPDVAEIEQKLPFRRPATFRLTTNELWSVTSNRTRVLKLDRVRSLRLEHLRGAYSRLSARLVVNGAEGTLVLFPSDTAASAAFADRCFTRILAASPALVLLQGLSQANYNLWIVMAVVAATFLILAILMVASGTPLSDMTGGLAILAMLPACGVNLMTGRPQEVSADDFRAALARASEGVTG